MEKNGFGRRPQASGKFEQGVYLRSQDSGSRPRTAGRARNEVYSRSRRPGPISQASGDGRRAISVAILAFGESQSDKTTRRRATGEVNGERELLSLRGSVAIEAILGWVHRKSNAETRRRRELHGGPTD